METNEHEGDGRRDWHNWFGRAPRQPDGEISVSSESWDFAWERFDGSWILDECTEEMDEPVIARSLMRMLIVRVAADAVRRDCRAEDLSDVVSVTHEYLDELPLSRQDLNAARRLLAALIPFDAEEITAMLLCMAWSACDEGLDCSARSLAQLAYDAAASHDCAAAAQGAALALARLAKLQECRRAARRWRGIAYLHSRREMKKRIDCGAN